MCKTRRRIAAGSTFGAALVVSGCATNDDVAMAKNTVDQEIATAEQAQKSASDAQHKVQEANQKVDAALANVKAL
jgi:hypothetical protein